MKKALVAGIAVAAVLGVLVAASAVVYQLQQTPDAKAAEVAAEAQDRQARITALLGNDQERLNDERWLELANAVIDTENRNDALLLISSNTAWQGAKQGGDFVQESVEGSGFAQYAIACDFGDIFSTVFQKQTESGWLNLYVAYDGNIIKQGSTTAQYGVVSLAGSCA